MANIIIIAVYLNKNANYLFIHVIKYLFFFCFCSIFSIPLKHKLLHRLDLRFFFDLQSLILMRKSMVLNLYFLINSQCIFSLYMCYILQFSHNSQNYFSILIHWVNLRSLLLYANYIIYSRWLLMLNLTFWSGLLFTSPKECTIQC